MQKMPLGDLARNLILPHGKIALVGRTDTEADFVERVTHIKMIQGLKKYFSP